LKDQIDIKTLIPQSPAEKSVPIPKDTRTRTQEDVEMKSFSAPEATRLGSERRREAFQKLKELQQEFQGLTVSFNSRTN